MTRAILAGLAAAAFALTACDEAGTTGRADSAAMPTAEEGRALFTEYCVVCHGSDATGGGELASSLNRSPADLTRVAARNGGSFPAARVLSHVDGYTKTDFESQVMPEFGELLAGEAVPYDSGDGTYTPTPRRLVALVEYLRSIQEAE
ncbi:c-type cytochrome [Roseivivax sediminis]|uniref:Cytochrome C oxidase, cbb3-type, subunit III n=1 Tax=Roseivivax sediminis TaxID=936889 RepID=A0A1I2CBH2_9RHOB|nr:cytochrome c [Roseivivax sediminis]SFE65666.1 Cytochrome C oxidase, cbb3-type, subunit III [Roseivivax sediminis]